MTCHPTVKYWKPARNQQKRLVEVAAVAVIVVAVVLVLAVVVLVAVLVVLVVVLIVVLIKVCHIPCQGFEHGPSYSLSFVDFLE